MSKSSHGGLFAAAKYCKSADNFGVKAKALTVLPYMRTKLEQTAYMRAEKMSTKGLPKRGRKRGRSEDKRRISQRELPTCVVAAQLFMWKPFEDCLAGLFVHVEG